MTDRPAVRALVIGADGFVGRWLCSHLLASGDAVTAVVGPRFARPIDGVDVVKMANVRDAVQIAAVVRDAPQDAIYYLAGVSRRGAREELASAAGVSVTGAVDVLVAAGAQTPPPRLLYVSTGLVYADGTEARREDSEIAPEGMYAAAKYAGEVALRYLGSVAGVDVLVARAFNHIGPGQSLGFVVPDIAQQIIRLRSIQPRVLRLSVAHTVRDFSDVRDVVRAYRLLATRGEAGVYNIGSGRGTAILDLAHMMLSAANLTAEVVADQESPNAQQSSLIADTSKIEALGWRREISLQQSLRDVIHEHALLGTAGRSPKAGSGQAAGSRPSAEE